MKHLETSLKWLQKAPNKHIVRLLTVIHNSPQRGSPGSNLIIAFKCDTVTCIGDKDPHEKWSVFSKECSPSADINIKIVLRPGAISTTCTYVGFLVFAYANTNAHTHTYIFLFKFSPFMWLSVMNKRHQVVAQCRFRATRKRHLCHFRPDSKPFFFYYSFLSKSTAVYYRFSFYTCVAFSGTVWICIVVGGGGTRPATQN